MSWLEKLLPPRIKYSATSGRKSIPDGLWVKCAQCEAALFRADLEANLRVCPKCGHHMRIGARDRLNVLLDDEGRYEIGQEVLPVDTLKFKDTKKYVDRLNAAMEASGETDAMVVFGGSIMSMPVVVACFEFAFIGGSMGSVVGERFVRGAQESLDQNVPFICFAASGGARMQEGTISLMQMAKTTAMLSKLSEKRLPFISILADPTSGGVAASFAFLGDIVIAEPNALIAFTGQRILANTLREKLPEGYQRAEYLLRRGAIDMIVDRRKQRTEIAQLLALLLHKPIDSVA